MFKLSRECCNHICASGNRTLRVETNLVRVEITLVRVVISFVRVVVTQRIEIILCV
jgi:hypothetical protein